MSETALKAEMWDIAKIIPYPGNAKKHPPEQVDAIAANMREFGFDQYIVVDKDGVIIKGHGRRLASIKNGYKKVPVICRRDLTPEQVRVARLSDNRVTSTEYDNALMHDELSALAGGDLDLLALGFSGKELEFMTADLGDPLASAFTDDVTSAVDAQGAANELAMAEIEASEVAVGEAFGFKKITLTQSRRVRGFIAQCEEETGKLGAEALMAFLDELGIA